MEVPYLSAKIDLLLRHHPTIKTQKAIAKHLGIDPANISRWISGNAYGDSRNTIPLSHVAPFSQLFNIDLKWLELESVEHFETLLLQDQIDVPPWLQLVRKAESSDALQLCLISRSLTGRRLQLPERLGTNPSDGFRQFDKVYIELDLQKLTPPLKPPVYLLLLSIGSAELCLCPTESTYMPHHYLTELKMNLPNGAPEDFLIVDEKGYQKIVALLTQQPLADSLYEKLIYDYPTDLKPILNGLAKLLAAFDDGSWRLLKFDYMVFDRNTLSL